MRKGINPAKRAGLAAHTPASVGVISLIFIPSLAGFYTHALDVIELHLNSLRKTLPKGEILVWDNGSVSEVVQFLKGKFRDGEIDYLFLSKYNLGKSGVMNWLFTAMPHSYIVFTDGDILFLKGWWEAVQEIFRSFPKAGMVSPEPAFFDVLRGKSRTVAMLKKAGYQVYSAEPMYREAQIYYSGIGYDTPKQLVPLPFAKAPNGIIACARSNHRVFVMPQKIARAIPPLPAKRALSRQSDRMIHEKVEEMGYWQLSTSRAFVYHLGNTPFIPPFLKEETAFLNMTWPNERPQTPQHVEGWKGRIRAAVRRTLQRSPRLRKKVERIYDALFRLLYGEI